MYYTTTMYILTSPYFLWWGNFSLSIGCIFRWVIIVICQHEMALFLFIVINNISFPYSKKSCFFIRLVFFVNHDYKSRRSNYLSVLFLFCGNEPRHFFKFCNIMPPPPSDGNIAAAAHFSIRNRLKTPFWFIEAGSSACRAVLVKKRFIKWNSSQYGW